MAKRPLGISQKNKSKKQKKETTPVSKENSNSPQLTFQVNENEDPENEITQLKTLLKSYLDSPRDTETLLNGVINECNSAITAKNETLLNDIEFYVIFAIALSELSVFKVNDSKLRINDIFENAMDAIKLGMEKNFKDTSKLRLIVSKIIFQRIPLEYISKLKVSSTKIANIDLSKMLKEGIESFSVIREKDMDQLELCFEILKSFDDLLDIVENFGTENNLKEGLDSDDDEELDEEEDEEIVLKKNHPLHGIKNNLHSHYKWLKNQFIELFEFVSETYKGSKLYHSIAKSTGELYLKDAEIPSSTYVRLQYGHDDGGDEEITLTEEEEKLAAESQKEALNLIKSALEYLDKAQISDDPETWVQVAEAYIDLGNIHDYGSTEQEDAYKKAEELLKRANVASHNKYEDILNNLLQKD
ncbi:hypothetical protein KAFR_0C06130 [Kazachstania africana CBS 2517]|uniref:Enhancer of translation termination 1 n=1 Tax=Kazachstania africana (strain ATCC 22294 / BCRC 22015 / CBS 2517 / CECT 1963 / NBRC 1671 / NRRL Y-8276) TaxID=1071382 RepID=H2ATA5_KAZAF|nr:hypothetical protein KAFR_0C06130 [Kazachstania africana CBS 2517]CCF57605.1 hypothetical protein KAFR_0C06130 [Kazachstania africana CBS 2517]